MTPRVYILLLFIFLHLSFSWAKNPFYYQINTADGLDNNTIYDFDQDRFGFYWIASESGIYKYDGVLLRKINLHFNTGAHNIQIDKYNRVWFQDFDGHLYYYNDKKVIQIKNYKLKGYFKYQLANEKLYLPLQDYFAEIDLKTLTSKKLHHLETRDLRETFLVNNELGFILSDQIIIGNKAYTIPKDFKEIIESPLITVIYDKVYIFDKYNKEFYYIFSNGKFIKQKEYFDIDFKQNLDHFGPEIWISSTSGLTSYNIITKKKQTYFNHKNISSIYKDLNNNYWIPTLTEGILFVENLNSEITFTDLQPNRLAHLNGDLIISNLKDEIYRYHKGGLTPVYQSPANHSYIFLKTNPKTNAIIGTSSKFRWIQNGKMSEAYFSIKDVIPIGPNNYAFAASRFIGLVTNSKAIHEQNKIKYPNQIYQVKDGLYFTIFSLEVNGISVAYNPTNDVIYYASKNGLYQLRNNKLSKIIFKNGQNIYIKKIYFHHNYLIGLTDSGQLLRLNSDHSTENFNLPQIIRQNGITNIKKSENNLYIYTLKAVHLYDLENHKFMKLLNINSNFNANDVEQIGDTIYFATSLGILKKRKEELLSNHIPTLKLNNILVNGEIIDLHTNRYFRSHQNNFEIRFYIFSSVPNDYYKIAYKINNEEWNYIDSKVREINLQSLAAGDYTVRIKVEGNFENKIEQKIQFTIKKAIWANIYFQIGFILFIIGLAYILSRKKVTNIQQKNDKIIQHFELQNELNIQKLISIKSQMNPHFFYNALNTIQSYILTNDKKLALFYLSKFSKLTRQILNLSEKDFISLKEELETNEIYLEIEKARFNGDFEYYIYNNDVDLSYWKFPSLLLQPIIENAIKHGLLHLKKKKKLKLSIKQTDDKIFIYIDDNGIGRAASQKLNKHRKNHTSFATKALENRVNILNQTYNLNLRIDYIDLYDEQNNAVGTKVIISLTKHPYESNNN